MEFCQQGNNINFISAKNGYKKQTMQNELRKQQALEYHAKGRPGKIEVVPTKEAKTPKGSFACIFPRCGRAL